MTATDIENFACAVGEFVDAMKRIERVTACNVAMTAMVAANAERRQQGHSDAYAEVHFLGLIAEYGLDGAKP